MIIATVTTIFLKLLDLEFPCDLLKFLDFILETSFCFLFVLSIFGNSSYVLSILLSDIVSLDCTHDNLLQQFARVAACTVFEISEFLHTTFILSDSLLPQFSQKIASLEITVPHLLHY